MAANNATALVGFQPESQSARGTIGILWLCLPTIFLCMYTSFHPDVSSDDFSDYGDYLAPGPGYTKTFLRVCVYAIFPDLALYFSVSEFFMARELRKKWNSFQSATAISSRQAHLLLMKGWYIEPLRDSPYWQPVPYFVGSKFDSNVGHLNHRQEAFREFQSFVHSTLPSDKTIDLMQTRSILVRVVTAAQTLWFLLQVIGRLAVQLPVSLPEAVTSAYIVVTAFSYAFWWQKPCRVRLAAKQQFPSESRRITSYMITYNEKKEFICYKKELVIVFFFIFSMFTVPCLAAWNYSFPNLVEARMWQVSCLAMVISGPLSLTFDHFLFVDRRLRKFGRYAEGVLDLLLCYLPAVFFLFARLYVLVEAFISLRSAPSGIYESMTWTKYWVHIGS